MTSRIFAVDVGVKHLSCVLLRLEAGATADATAALRGATLEEWAVEALTAPSFADVLEAAVRFVERRRETLRGCRAVVIEQQMAPRMRCVAAALYAAARAHAPETRVLFQPAASKLRWAPEVWSLAPGARTDSYSRRKTAASRLCAGLLRAAGQTAAAQQLSAARKKDDLADALLHGLRFACDAAAPPAKRRRTTAPSSPPARSAESSSSRSPTGTPRPAAASAPAEA